MLDHPIVDLISAVRDSFERALLERQAVEERFQVDVFLGDLSWETSYSLPGEGQPPRVRADLSFDWPTWSQTAYRSWSIGESPDELPEVVVEVAMRIQRLAEAPTTHQVLAVLPTASPDLGGEPLERSATTVEEVRADAGGGRGPGPGTGGPGTGGPGTGGPGTGGPGTGGPGTGGPPTVRWAVEAAYEGSLRLEEAQLEDPATLAPIVDTLTRWVSSTLVQLADLPLKFLPPDPADED